VPCAMLQLCHVSCTPCTLTFGQFGPGAAREPGAPHQQSSAPAPAVAATWAHAVFHLHAADITFSLIH
jgi:hypothetical protein